MLGTTRRLAAGADEVDYLLLGGGGEVQPRAAEPANDSRHGPQPVDARRRLFGAGDDLRQLIAALLDHRGQSRLVLTSRVRPQPVHPRVLALPVHSLTLEEAALLARQSPNLGRLLRDPAHRPLVIRTLKLVQGHPELLKLAEAQASSPERLTAHLDAAEQAATAGAAQLEAGQGGPQGRHPQRTFRGWDCPVIGITIQLS